MIRITKLIYEFMVTRTNGMSVLITIMNLSAFQKFNYNFFLVVQMSKACVSFEEIYYKVLSKHAAKKM